MWLLWVSFLDFCVFLYFFLSRPQLLVLPLTICYFAPSLRLIPQQLLIFPVISLCDSSRCTPVKVLQIPLPLKPEGLSRSTQITSPRLCICFQFCAINKAGLRMFLSISYSSIFLLFLPVSLLPSPQLSGTWPFFMCHSNQNNVGSLSICLFLSLGGPLHKNNPPMLVCSRTSVCHGLP